MRILAVLRQVSEQAGASSASVALAWLLSRPNVLAPIASATKVEHLEDLFAAADLRLSTEHLKALSMASTYDLAEHEPAMTGALPANA